MCVESIRGHLIWNTKRKKEKGLESWTPMLTEFMAQMKMKNKGNPFINDDISPKNYLLGRMGKDDLDGCSAFF